MSLYRTFADRTSRYYNDGFGRDSYIEFNNGGIYKNSHTLSPQEKNARLQDWSPPRPRMDSKRFSYIPNGSGRDSYISVTSGGFFPSGRTLGFAGGLRNYQDKTEIDKNDKFFQVQVSWLKKRRHTILKDDPVNRLSEPKHKRSKVSEELGPSYRKLIINRVY